MIKWLAHLRTINHHRRLVRRACFRVGLYLQGLTHDLSKYTPVEFLVGAKYFQGDHSPNEAERLDKGYSAAWLHHKGRNKHHLEYWIDYDPQTGAMGGMEMPIRYVAEMFCDRVAATRIYQKERYTDAAAYDYYVRSEGHYLIHPNTAALIKSLLKMLRDEGEEKTFDYIRREILHNKKHP